MADEAPEPRHAATLIMLRKTVSHPLQTLMVVRQEAIEFAGGAIVFLGGRVDELDHIVGQQGDDPFRFAPYVKLLKNAVFCWRMIRLAAFESVDEALDTIRNTPVVTLRPESVNTPEGKLVRIPPEAS